jgi:hypothetical protein
VTNDSTRGIHRSRRASTLAGQASIAAIASAALALAPGAFGGSPSSTRPSPARPSTLSQSSNIQKALAYSRCMRSHGVPRFPDPTSSGAIPKVSLQQLGVSSSRWETAQTACRYLLPNSGGGPSKAELQQWMNGMFKFAHCMRSHGVSNWPDPVIDAGGNPEFYLDGKIDQNAPQIKTRINECLHWLPSFAISPGNPVACPGADPGPGATGACSGSRRRS